MMHSEAAPPSIKESTDGSEALRHPDEPESRISGRQSRSGIARLHYLQNGSPYLMQDELLRVERDRRYGSPASGDVLTAEVETTLTPRDGGTQLDACWTGTGRTPLLRILVPFMRRKIARQPQADLVKLKDLVEGQPRRGSSPPPARPLDQVAN
jgi:hypothetical protein